MQTSNDVELELARILGTSLTPTLRKRIDDRVLAAVAAPVHPAATPRARRGHRAAILALVAVVTIGAIGAGLDAFQRILTTPGWATAWERADYIGASVVANEHEVILEGVYADAGQVVVGVSSPTLMDLLSTSGIWVVDGAGRELRPLGGTGSNEAGRSVMVYAFVADEPLDHGDQQFDITVRSNDFEQPWEFTVPVTVLGADALALDVSSTASGMTVHLHQAVISPTLVRLKISVDEPGNRADSHWSVVSTVRRGGDVLHLNGSEPELESVAGVDESSGRWELVITELIGEGADGEPVRLSGPWILPFDVP